MEKYLNHYNENDENDDIDIYEILYNNKQYLNNVYIPNSIKKYFNKDYNLERATFPTLRYYRLVCLLKQKIRRSNTIHISYSVLLIENKKPIGIKINYAHSIGTKLGIVHPSMLSKDGEYRTGLCSIKGLLLYSNTYKTYDLINGFIRKKFGVTWALNYKIYGYLDNEVKHKEMIEIKDEIEKNGLELVLLVSAWLIYHKRVDEGTYITNINDDIHKLFGSSSDKEFYLKLKEKFSKEINILYWLSVVYYEDKDIDKNYLELLPKKAIQLGIKMIPLRYNEIGSVDDFTSRVWKEIAINKACNDLILNGVCDGLPMMGEWYYVHGSDDDLFDNPNIHVKIKDSIKAKKTLYQINKSSAVGTTSDDILNKVRVQMKAPMENIKDYLSISETSVCFISEDVGRTFMNHFLLKDSRGWGVGRDGDMFGDMNIFKKYIFEWMYSLYSLNNIGVFQGDLHLNNITLNGVFKYAMETYKDYMPLASYEVGDDVFLIPYFPVRATIIDFSRAVVNTTSEIFRGKKLKSIWDVVAESENKTGGGENGGVAEILYDNKYTAPTEFFEGIFPQYSEQITTEQYPQILKLIERHFPSFYEINSGKLETLIETNFDQVWAIMCASDMYSLTFYMAELMREEITRSGNFKKGIYGRDLYWSDRVEWLERVYKFLGEYITTNLSKLLSNKVPADYKFPNPNAACIKHVYKDWKFGAENGTWDFNNLFVNPKYYRDGVEIVVPDRKLIITESLSPKAPILWSIRDQLYLPNFMLETKKMTENGIVAPSLLRSGPFNQIESTRHRQETIAEFKRIIETRGDAFEHDMFKYMDYFVEKKMWS